MIHYPKIMIAAFLLGIYIISPQPSCAQNNQVDETPRLQPVSWTELIFKGSKLTTRITVKIQLSSGDLSAKSESDPHNCSEIVTADKLLTVQSASKGMTSSQSKYEEKIWFNETAIQPVKRDRLNSGNEPWVKSYCWENEGVRRQRIQPGTSSEKKQSSTDWKKRDESFYKYPIEVTGCDTISDPSLVFYMLSTMEFDRQQKPFKMCVFGRKQLHRLTIGLEKDSSLKVAYKDRSSSGEVAVEDKINPVVYSMTTETFAPDNKKPEAYSFLGLNKDIRIYMDPAKRLPVRISGTNNSVGELVLDLKTLFK